MEYQFDPFELKVFPRFAFSLKRSSAFLAGIIFNRIFHGLSICKEIGNSIDSCRLNFVKKDIKKIEKWIDFFVPDWNSFGTSLDWVWDELNGVRELVEREKYSVLDTEFVQRQVSKDSMDRLRISRVNEGKGKAMVLKAEFGDAAAFFELGLIVDGATHGFSSLNREVEFVEIKRSDVKKNKEWAVSSGGKLKPSKVSLFSGGRNFLSHPLNKINGINFKFKVLDAGFVMPDAQSWGMAIVDTWNELAQVDQEEAGFKRVKMENGDIYVDGEKVGYIPPGNDAYIALKYIVERRSVDPCCAIYGRDIFKAIRGHYPDKDKDGRIREFNNIYRGMSDELKKIFPRPPLKNHRRGISIGISGFRRAILA